MGEFTVLWNRRESPPQKTFLAKKGPPPAAAGGGCDLALGTSYFIASGQAAETPVADAPAVSLA